MRLSVSVSRVSAKCCWADSEGKHLSCLYVYERDVKATYFALGPLVSATTHFRICGEKNWREIVFAQPAPAPPLPSPPLKAKISLRPRQMQQRAPQFGARCALCGPTRCYFVACGTRFMVLQTKFEKRTRARAGMRIGHGIEVAPLLT